MKIKKKLTGIKKDKTFLLWLYFVHPQKSYITTLIFDSKHYVQTRVPCVKTYMTEYSTDSLANSPPRPSNYSKLWSKKKRERGGPPHFIFSLLPPR